MSELKKWIKGRKKIPVALSFTERKQLLRDIKQKLKANTQVENRATKPIEPLSNK